MLIEQEFDRHITDCNDSKRAHLDLADYFYIRSKAISNVQNFGIALLLGWLLSTQFQGILSNDNIINKALPVVLGLVASLLSALEPVFRYKESAIAHEQAGKKYHTLWRTCKNWRTDYPDSSHIREARAAAQKYREQLNEINRDSPHLSSFLWGKIDKMRVKNSFDPSVYSSDRDGPKTPST